jgi:hypothetical protein
MGEWTPFQTHYLSENLVAQGIDPGTSGSIARNSDHQNTEAVIKNITATFIAIHQCQKYSDLA